MSYLNLIGVSFLFLVSLSCKDSSTSSSSSIGFSLKISVKSTGGAPVPNLRVVGGSLTSFRYFMNQSLLSWVNRADRARLIAEDSTGTAQLFRDSVLMVCADVDIGNPPAILGYTSGSGDLMLNDANRFPGIFSLPPIPQTEQDPTPVGQFTISDTAVFIFVDTLSFVRQTDLHVLHAGVNSMSVQWSPSVMNERNPSGSAGHVNYIKTKTTNRMEPSSLLAVTSMTFAVPVTAKVNLSVLQPDGKIIATLVDQRMAPGFYIAQWRTNAPTLEPKSIRRIASPSPVIPQDWELSQNFPNPYN